MTNLAAIKEAPVILWVNYNSEGWSPRPFSTVSEALAEAQSGLSGEWIITRAVRFIAKD